MTHLAFLLSQEDCLPEGKRNLSAVIIWKIYTVAVKSKPLEITAAAILMDDQRLQMAQDLYLHVQDNLLYFFKSIQHPRVQGREYPVDWLVRFNLCN